MTVLEAPEKAKENAKAKENENANRTDDKERNGTRENRELEKRKTRKCRFTGRRISIYPKDFKASHLLKDSAGALAVEAARRWKKGLPLSTRALCLDASESVPSLFADIKCKGCSRGDREQDMLRESHPKIFSPFVRSRNSLCLSVCRPS